IDRKQVVPEILQVPIGRAIDAIITAKEVDAARRRHRDLRGARGRLAHEREFVGSNAPGTLDLGFDIRRLEGGVTAARVVEVEDRVPGGQPVDRLHEAVEPGTAAKLAIGDRREPNRFLHRDRVANAAVLDLGELVGVDPALRRVTKRSLEFARAQQAADMLGPKRRSLLRRHGTLRRTQPRLSTKRAALMLASNSLLSVPASRNTISGATSKVFCTLASMLRPTPSRSSPRRGSTKRRRQSSPLSAQ